MSPAPKPHDPHRPLMTPEELDATVTSIMAMPTASLSEEAEQLEAAHAVLSEALKKN